MAVDIEDTTIYDEAIKCRIEGKIDSVKIGNQVDKCVYEFKVYLNNTNTGLYFDENKYSKPYYTDIMKTCNPNDILKENYPKKDVGFIVNAELNYQTLRKTDKNSNLKEINLCLMNREKLSENKFEISNNIFYGIIIFLILIICILIFRIYKYKKYVN